MYQAIVVVRPITIFRVPVRLFFFYRPLRITPLLTLSCGVPRQALPLFSFTLSLWLVHSFDLGGKNFFPHFPFSFPSKSRLLFSNNRAAQVQPFKPREVTLIPNCLRATISFSSSHTVGLRFAPPFANLYSQHPIFFGCN